MGQFGAAAYGSAFCAECGNALLPRAAFCGRCGTPASGPETVALQDGTYHLAGFGRRLSGHLIDQIIVTGPALVVLFVLIVQRASADCPPGALNCPRDRSVLDSPGWSLLLFQGLPFLYWAAWNSVGTSPGRWLVGTRLVTRAGLPPGFRRGCIRALVSTLASGTLLFLGYLWAAWDRDRQTWHDHVAGTWVVTK